MGKFDKEWVYHSTGGIVKGIIHRTNMRAVVMLTGSNSFEITNEHSMSRLSGLLVLPFCN